MKYFLIVVFVLTFVTQAQALNVQRRDTENDCDFVERITQAVLVEDNLTVGGHVQLNMTKKLIKGRNVLVAFTQEKTADETETDMQLNVFIPQTGQDYAWLKAESCEIEGGAPTLRAFFYANADRFPGLDIGVICGWDAVHPYAECSMTDDVRFYKMPTDLNEGELEEIKDKKFAGFYKKEPAHYGNEQCQVPKFSTAADVKTMLLHMGFR